MKKIVFLFAMVLVAGVVMAQTAVINQTNQNDGIDGSTGNGPGYNVAQVTQNGANTVTIDQLQSIEGNPGGTATVTAIVKQQGGTSNNVDIDQTHTGTKNNGVWNLDANASQKGGDGNSIIQNQFLGGGDWGPMAFTAMQNGTENSAYQAGINANGAEGLIEQKGQTNTAQQVWENNASGYGDGNGIGGIFIKQDGTSNQAYQTFQQPGQVWTNGRHNRGEAIITQKGEGNIAYQTQQGNGNDQSLYQNGTGNYANMVSTGNFNDAFAAQTGDGGEIILIQQQVENGSAGMDMESDGNVANLKQDADAYMYIFQDGLRNMADISQFADGASTILNQVGTDNTAIVVQN